MSKLNLIENDVMVIVMENSNIDSMLFNYVVLKHANVSVAIRLICATKMSRYHFDFDNLTTMSCLSDLTGLFNAKFDREYSDRQLYCYNDLLHGGCVYICFFFL